MTIIKSSVSFPEGYESVVGSSGYANLNDIKKLLIGRTIISIEYVNHSTVKLSFDNNSSVELTPSGLEGDDLELCIELSK